MQAPTQPGWFYSTAPAAWTTALIAVGTLIFNYIRRRRPSRILIREIQNSSLLSVPDVIRDEIEVTFEKRPIQQVGEIFVQIFNDGSETIRQPKFFLTLPQNANILAAHAFRPCEGQLKYAIKGNTVGLTLDFLNPVREHKHRLAVVILADGDTKNVTATGSGEGWSVRYEPLPSTTRQMKIGIATGFLSGAIGSACVTYLRHLEHAGTKPTHTTLLAILGTMIIGVALLLAGAVPILRRAWTNPSSIIR